MTFSTSTKVTDEVMISVLSVSYTHLPSPLSAYRGFFGCRHFSKQNEFLIQNGLESIDWQIENKEQQEIKE